MTFDEQALRRWSAALRTGARVVAVEDVPQGMDIQQPDRKGITLFAPCVAAMPRVDRRTCRCYWQRCRNFPLKGGVWCRVHRDGMKRAGRRRVTQNTRTQSSLVAR